MKTVEKRGEKRQQHRSGLPVRRVAHHDPLTPEGGKPRKRRWRDSSDCWSPTVLERKQSLTTQVVPQIGADVVVAEKERVVMTQVDDEPQTPRGQIIKVPTEPPPLKPVFPLPGHDGYHEAASSCERDSSPCLLKNGLCGWV